MLNHSISYIDSMQDAVRSENVDDVLLPGGPIGRKLKELRRATLSIPNRLRSISEDAHFVRVVADAYGLPLIANERCGSWYISPEHRAASAYFKSTDGHMNQWAISSRRLNLHVLHIVGERGGCIIVDSTRRGKTMPDALSKTIPIWCAVINRLVFPDNAGCHSLYTPIRCVSASEHQQIERRLSDFAQQFEALDLDLADLGTTLKKPLKALWVTRDSTLPDGPPSYPDFHPIVLCTASRRVAEGDVAADGYVQGAGDDNEGWSRGLTADMFWASKNALLEADEGHIAELVDKLVKDNGVRGAEYPDMLIKPTSWLYCGLATGELDDLARYKLVLHCSPVAHEAAKQRLKDRYVHFKCREGKLGSRDLRRQLPKLSGLVGIEAIGREECRILAAGEPGSDHAIGLALALLCLHDAEASGVSLDKDFIRQRLSWISMSVPQARPLRATLQSVNEFLMSGDRSTSCNLST